MKLNRKRKNKFDSSQDSLDKLTSGIKRRASRLYLKTKKKGNIIKCIFLNIINIHMSNNIRLFDA